jgi:RNA polymerase sigma-54 factor
MSQGLQLGQHLTQSLVLSPQLQQSLALLQAPILELKAMVEKELEQNPVLEEVPVAEAEQQAKAEETGEPATTDFDPSEPAEQLGEDAAAEPKPAAETGAEPGDDFQAEFDRLAELDQEWREHFAQANLPVRTSPEEEERRQFMLDSLTRGESLQESLLEQMRTSDLSELRMAIAEIIIGNLDDYGYLKTSLEELAATASAPVEEAAEALRVVQTFDPPGVGARDLRECLLLQMERAGHRETVEYRIVAKYMDLLARRRVPELAERLALTVAEVQEAMSRIARLEPRPGREFLPDDEQFVVPEVFVRRADDDFVVSTNNSELPHLRISNTYKDLMSRGTVDLAELEGLAETGEEPARGRAKAVAAAVQGKQDQAAVALLRQWLAESAPADPTLGIVQRTLARMIERQSAIETRTYVRDKIAAAKFLIKSIDLRQKTLLRIAREIVARQREFMDKGVAFLKPVTMAQVAAVVGVHETTVSRAVSGKYVQTPQGTFDLKYFFTAGLHTDGGGDIANTSVKGMVAEIFRAEDAKKPLADDEVAKMLQAKGINIARRTVAKYRGELGILPSGLRKVY